MRFGRSIGVELTRGEKNTITRVSGLSLSWFAAWCGRDGVD